MNEFYWYILITLAVEIISILLLSRKFKKHLPSMSRMVLSMTYAVTISLILGLTLGILYQGDLFTSTLISVLLGLIAGIFVGIGLGILSSIEGAMSGLMGGMMGAMLGEMISSKEGSFLLMLLLTFSICSKLLFFVLYKEERPKKIEKSWLLKPLIVMVGISLYLLIGFHLSQNITDHTSTHHYQHKAADKGETKFIHVITINNTYVPNNITVKLGKKVTLQLDNLDSVEHDFEIKNMSIIETGNNNHNHSSKEVIHLHALPLNKSEITFSPLIEGEYEFYCTIPGHKEAGMKGKIIVTKKNKYLSP